MFLDSGRDQPVVVARTLAGATRILEPVVDRLSVNDWAGTNGRRLLDALMNDDQSPLTTLISCMVCAKTMKLERISPDDAGDDLLQYRCGQCGRIERLRLIRRSWP
jgi:hypothetical protein